MVSTSVVLVVTIQVLALLSVLFVYASLYKKVAPDRAMVVYGRQMRPGIKIGYLVITGGGKFLLPIIEDVKFMDLGLKETVIELDNLRTDPGTEPSRIRIRLTALYKISSERSALAVACEHLLDKTPEDIRKMTEVLINGHVRGIVANMSSRAVDMHRQEVEEKLMNQAAGDLLNLGIEVRVMRIIDVHPKGGS